MKETVPGSESIPGRPDTTAPDGRPVIDTVTVETGPIDPATRVTPSVKLADSPGRTF